MSSLEAIAIRLEAIATIESSCLVWQSPQVPHLPNSSTLRAFSGELWPLGPSPANRAKA